MYFSFCRRRGTSTEMHASETDFTVRLIVLSGNNFRTAECYFLMT
jgi:hypothetical protein